MNKKDDNLESLEQELKALKKKKLQKEIYKLEKELSIVPKTTPAQKKTKPQTTPKTNAQSKIDKILFVIFSLLVLVVLLVADLDNDGVSGFNELTSNGETIEVLDQRHMFNASREYEWGDRKGCIPILFLDFKSHPKLENKGVFVEVRIKNYATEWRYELNGGEGFIILPATYNFGSNENLTNINNFAGQRDIQIELTAINDKNRYTTNLNVPEDIFNLPNNAKYQTLNCSYRINN